MSGETDRPTHSPFGLSLIVFAAGACLMCFEIIGAMTVAPYFGSTVYVWGSVLVVFMGALSLGYVLGGRVADVRPDVRLLSLLAVGAGLLVMISPLIGPAVCGLLLRVDAGVVVNRFRPLLAIAILFFLPSMLLGMITPIAIRVASTALASVGRVVGRLYALNAVGSVVGTLIATFVLGVLFGNRAILIGCGLTLGLVGLACMYLQRNIARAGPPVSHPHIRKAPDEAGAAVPGLRPLVFVCGMVLMSLQVIGGAQIAPYFGSTVFVWGSVITVFLVALAVGYRLGGRIADRWPTMRALATVVVAAGIAILVVPIIAPALCGALLRTAPGQQINVLRPLVASLALYAVPIGLLAMVAPFAVRLGTRRVGGVGGVAGRFYALSTLGNVAGVFLATFVLISAVGRTGLFEWAGFTAVLAAALALCIYERKRTDGQPPVLVSVVLLVAVGLLAFRAPKPPILPLVDRSRERSVGIVEAEDGGRWHLIEHIQARPPYHSLRRVIARRDSPYHHMAVIENAAVTQTVLGPEAFRADQVRLVGGEWRPVTPREALRPAGPGHYRDLRFDQYTQSSVMLDSAARRLHQPYTSGTLYSTMLHLPFVLNRDIRTVLVIGGGGGVVPMIFREHYAERGIRIDAVEIDPEVVRVAREFFGLVEDEQLRVHVRDGRMFVHNADDRYDLIILDAYTAGGRIPFHLTTREFIAECGDLLTDDGLLLMNVISALDGPRSKLFRAEYKTFREVFGPDRVYVFPRDGRREMRDRTQNVMLVVTGRATDRRLSKQEVVRRADREVRAGRIELRDVAYYARQMLTTADLAGIPLDDVPVLTDDYAPVDFMVVPLEE